MKNKYLKWVSVLLSILGCTYSIYALTSNFKALPSIKLDFVGILMICAALMLLLVISFIFSLAWRELLKAAGYDRKVFEIFRLVGVSQIGKYIPGNVFHYVGRAVGSCSLMVPSRIVGITILLETLLVVLVAVSFSSGLIWNRVVSLGVVKINYCLSLIIVLAILAGYLYSSGRFKDSFKACCDLLNTATLVKVTMLYVGVFILQGIALQLVGIVVFGKLFTVSLSSSIFRMALCNLAGFIVPGAPAGLGVRESLVIKLFEADIGLGVSASLAIFYRALTVISDVLLYLIAVNIKPVKGSI